MLSKVSKTSFSKNYKTPKEKVSYFDIHNEAFILFFVSLIIYVGILFFYHAPLGLDEGTYALMLTEFSKDPAMIIPTITGIPLEWKPPLFTWIYSIPYLLLKNANLGVEFTLRLPSAVFGSLCVFLFYLIAEKLYGKRAALASSIIFMTSPLILLNSILIMMEVFSLFLILAAIYFYIDGKPLNGMVFLSLLCITKWLYVAAPVLFITLFFMRKKEFGFVLTTFLIIPISLLTYLLISYFFGNISNALLAYSLDLARPIPTINPNQLFVYYGTMIITTSPLSLLALFLVLSRKIAIDASTLALGAIAFVLPFSQFFIYWYAIVSIPAFALIVGSALCKDFENKLILVTILIALICSNLLFATFSIQYQLHTTPISGLASFIKGKNVSFVIRSDQLSPVWGSLNTHYTGTNESYLLLEQIYPGILFYRFNDSNDYYNLHTIILDENESPVCKEYIVVSQKKDAPDCFGYVGNFSDLYIYRAG